MLGFGHETVLHVLWYKTLLTCLTSQFFGKTIAFCSSSEGNCVQSEAECYDVKTLICYNQWRQQEHNKCWYKLIIVDLLQRLSIKFLGPPPNFSIDTPMAIYLCCSLWFIMVQGSYASGELAKSIWKLWHHEWNHSLHQELESLLFRVNHFELWSMPIPIFGKHQENAWTCFSIYDNCVVVETFNWTKRW